MPIWMLLSVFFALLLLTVATVYQSTFSLGNLEVWMSLSIATVKAGLVIAFFMHLLWDKPLNAIIIFSSLIFVTPTIESFTFGKRLSTLPATQTLV